MEIRLIREHLLPGGDGPVLLEQLLYRRLRFHPEGLCIRDNDLHALALQMDQDGRLAGLDLAVGPVFRLFGGCDDEVLVGLGQFVEELMTSYDLVPASICTSSRPPLR